MYLLLEVLVLLPLCRLRGGGLSLLMNGSNHVPLKRRGVRGRWPNGWGLPEPWVRACAGLEIRGSGVQGRGDLGTASSGIPRAVLTESRLISARRKPFPDMGCPNPGYAPACGMGDQGPHGGARPFHRKSTCTTQSTLGVYVRVVHLERST